MKNKTSTDTRTERVEAAPLALTLRWKQDKLASLSVERAHGEYSDAPSPMARAFRSALLRCVNGEPPRWPEPELDDSSLTPFARRVMDTLREHAPAGTTVTYAQLAELAGSPGAARAVGRVMASNPWPLLYPCHRVVGTNGKLTGFSAEGGIETKALLLKLERDCGSLPC